MKMVYWRPQKVSKHALLLVGLVALGGLALVEATPATRIAPYHQEKLAAARLAESYMQVIKQHRQRPINTVLDPHGTGMVGDAMTLITSKPADWAAKRKSVDPNFAAALVQLLKDAGASAGDVVAVGWSGSFPGLNASLCAAMETLQVRPLIVTSVMASQYGANDPEYVWLDMEGELARRGMISFRSLAGSVGGPADRGLGMMPEAIEAARAAIRRSGVKLLPADRLARSIQARMDLYQRQAGDAPIAAYVNVGGGIASTGGTKGNQQFQPGLNRRAKPVAQPVDCVMSRFLDRGTPVIHMTEIEALARQLGIDQDNGEASPIGVGALYTRSAPRRWMAASVLLVVVLMLHSFVLSGLGHQLWQDLLRLAFGRKPRLGVVGGSTPLDGPQLMV